MSKIEERKSAAATIVELLQAIISVMPEGVDFDIDFVLRESAEAMAIANRQLFTAESIGAAIAGIIYNHCEMSKLKAPESQKALQACTAFGEYFCKLMDSRAENFVPHHRQWVLLKSAIQVLFADEIMPVRSLAQKAVDAGASSNIDAARQIINDDIREGRLKAKKLGKQNMIQAKDAAEWLANPARGSRSEKEENE